LDIDAVTRLIQNAANELVLPRFRRLLATDVERKATVDDPEDVVTTVDRDVEARLTEGLQELMPSAAVIGEETAHGRAEILKLVHGERSFWLIDPIDGTRNFASGDARFGIIVGFVTNGLTRAGWILLPVEQSIFVAERGGGAFLNGTRVKVSPGLGDEILRGTVLSRYMPDALRQSVARGTGDGFHQLPQSGCAAVEYMAVLRGGADFVVYYRLLPWDHAAPALILMEAGGRVEHLGGEVYTPRSSNQLTIVARNEAVAGRLGAWLRARIEAGSATPDGGR
jgi:fructose-1,6-bisphosphatase/inositol monophosphatase family enzyme